MAGFLARAASRLLLVDGPAAARARATAQRGLSGPLKYDPNERPAAIEERHRHRQHHDKEHQHHHHNGKEHGRLQLCYKCKKCDARNVKFISKIAYTKGVVVVKCDGCHHNHLIADNLDWFADIAGGAKNIEDILKAKGERVLRLTTEDLQVVLKEAVATEKPDDKD